MTRQLFTFITILTISFCSNTHQENSTQGLKSNSNKDSVIQPESREEKRVENKEVEQILEINDDVNLENIESSNDQEEANDNGNSEYVQEISLETLIYFSTLDDKAFYLNLNNEGWTPTTYDQYKEDEEMVVTMNFKKGENNLTLQRLTRINISDYNKTYITNLFTKNVQLKDKLLQETSEYGYIKKGKQGNKILYENKSSFLYIEKQVVGEDKVVYQISIVR